MFNPSKNYGKMKKVFFFLNASDRVVVSTLVTVFAIAMIAVFFTSCSRDCPELPESRLDIGINDSISDLATINFVCQGDFEMRQFTRSLEADSKSMTDLWVLDYIGTVIAQQIHQVSTDADFGTPTLNLTVGNHHIYFIASRGSGATLSTENHTITFTRVLDTFYKDYTIDVTATSNGSRSVTLDRIVTKLTTVITDAIPEGASTFNLTPASWYYGFDYIFGEPTTATTSQTITINIPSSEIGFTNERLSIFGFSTEDEWTTNITLNCKKADGTILGSTVLANVPMKRNRITEYTGPLFSSSGATTVGLSTDWLDNYVSTW
jgi:hypothetical protein